MAERQQPSLHATHDVELIAGWSTGDLDAHERSRAIGMLDACPDCAALAADLQAITAAMSTLRYGSDALHRDFRLSAADAGRLRRGSALLRWLRPFTGSGIAFARPVGSLVTALALVGLVASSVPAGLNSDAAYGPSTDLATGSREWAGATEPSRPRDGVLVSSDGGLTSRPLLIPSLLLLAAGFLLLIGPRFARRLVGAAREP